MSKRFLPWLLMGFLITSSACSSQANPPSASGFIPASGAISGWSTNGSLMMYNPQNLFDLVDGQADSFTAYGFEQVTVQRYQDSQSEKLSVEVWQLASEDDAYGLFSASRAGTPVNIGNQGDGDPGLRLIFWQSRYYVQVNANQELPDDVIMGFAKAVLSAIPKGGTTPALVKQLPQQDLETGSEIFFHQEISIQSEVWLGGTNLMELGPETQGVVARYTVNGQPGHLLLVEYPTTENATSGLKALQGSQVTGLVVSAQNQKVAGAIFGSNDPKLALVLLDQGLLLPAVK